MQALEDPAAARGLSVPKAELVKHQGSLPMPPLEAVVKVLRWAKGLLLTTNNCVDFPNMNIRS